MADAFDDRPDAVSTPRRKQPPKGIALLMGLMITAPALPVAGMAATIVPFVMEMSRAAPIPTPTQEGPAVVLRDRAVPVLRQGALAGGAVWLVLAVVAMLVGTIERANHGVYRQLVARADALEADVQAPPPPAEIGDASALDQVRVHLDDLSVDLNRPPGSRAGSTRLHS